MCRDNAKIKNIPINKLKLNQSIYAIIIIYFTIKKNWRKSLVYIIFHYSAAFLTSQQINVGVFSLSFCLFLFVFLP